jgi:hypothetical protein
VGLHDQNNEFVQRCIKDWKITQKDRSSGAPFSPWRTFKLRRRSEAEGGEGVFCDVSSSRRISAHAIRIRQHRSMLCLTSAVSNLCLRWRCNSSAEQVNTTIGPGIDRRRLYSNSAYTTDNEMGRGMYELTLGTTAHIVYLRLTTSTLPCEQPSSTRNSRS